MTLIAEDLLILLLDDAKGTVSTWGTTDVVLGGAVLAELAILGLATVDEKKSIWRSAKVSATGAAPADLHPVLAEALAVVAAKDRAASTLVTKLGKGLFDRLAAGLAERRILERKDGKRLGLLPRTTWPAADTTRDNQLRRSITVCLVDGGRPDERTAALIGLLAAADQVHKAVTTNHAATRRQLKKRAKEIAEGQWVAKAVKDAVEAAGAVASGG
jgi:alkylhydroperoxidase family enzyme